MPCLVSVIVLNWNGKKLVQDCLQSIERNTERGKYEVIVVDNGSRDGSVEWLRGQEQAGKIRLIANPENKGFSHANNQGFLAAKGDYVYLLNNDTRVTKGWLSEAVKAAEAGKRIGIVGSRLYHPTEKIDESDFRVVEKQAVCGAGMLVQRGVIERIGYLDSDHFSPIYGEEIDFCYRARNAGYRVVEAAGSRVVHLGSLSMVMVHGKEQQYERLFTNTYKAMLYNLGLAGLLGHLPGYLRVYGLALQKGFLGLHVKAILNNLRNWKEVQAERKRRKTGQKIVPRGMP
ncbi:MAG TPA: glycosyltransferase family 2 protein [Candidatus Diapherotrites archaeon]|uniref:Glycosyltransferase family 2 protein n=1 Tax=Candidatus Iainarchaeum sp. TaxID=3101447 RepID=A0A7J4JMM0_9ARCH|nr:glycosyltransferase family 2 protein [Candidatus Diapherotrites archaeon]HIH16486.1 glycosyltransferase family 2 protein [Candidatus Diapherotrites archaeon]